MRGQRPPLHRAAAEAAVLVLRLPVGLQEEVPDQVADEEDVEDGDPAHLWVFFGLGFGFGFARSTLNL